MKFVIAATTALAGSAAAFTPASSSQRSSSTALAASFKSEIGVQPPLGLWDPLGFLDGADEAKFNKLRYAEVKHGRIAMLAIVGHMVTTSGIRLPGYESIPAGAAALSKLSTFDLLQVFGTVGVLELVVMKDVKGTGESPGDFLNGISWNASAEEKREKKTIELNNGRAAQMGILGLIAHEQINNEPYILNAFLGYPTHFNEGLL